MTILDPAINNKIVVVARIVLPIMIPLSFSSWRYILAPHTIDPIIPIKFIKIIGFLLLFINTNLLSAHPTQSPMTKTTTETPLFSS